MSAKRRTSAGRSKGSGRGRTILLVVGVIAAVAFAVEGGEYGTFDLLRQRSQERRLNAQIAELRHAVDSLQRYQRQLVTDPKLQERIAREEFGMVRGDKELLYRFAEPADTAHP